MNLDWKCRYPNCREDLPASSYFCEEHEKYKPLTDSLFKNTPKGGVTCGTPLTAVYVMGSLDVGAVKIGIAVNVLERLASIQTGFPKRISVFYAIYTERKKAERLERECHKTLREFDFHLNGEWFDADPDDAAALVQKHASDLGIPVLTAGEYTSIISLWDDVLHDSDVSLVRRRILLDTLQVQT